MEAIVSLLKNMDLKKLLPDLASFIGTIKFWLLLLILAGPILLLIFGLLYFFKPPKEANHGWGFRTYFTMGSVEVWLFAQKLAGFCWMILGGALTVAMLITGLILNGGSAYTMAVGAIWCISIELALVVISWVGINVVVLRFYDKDGNQRTTVKKPTLSLRKKKKPEA